MSNWVENVVGNANTQYMNSFGIGQDNNSATGNALLPLNFSGSFKGGAKSRRGGSLAGILATAAAPATLLAMQNQYKGKRNIYSRGRRRSRSRRSRSRRYRRR
jgi:hypothetical protein